MELRQRGGGQTCVSEGWLEPDLGDLTPGTDVEGVPVGNLCARSYIETAWPTLENPVGQTE